VRRRAFTAGVLALAGAPLTAHSQEVRRARRIGYISTGNPDDLRVQALRQGLRELGLVEGENVVIDWQFATNPESARELIGRIVQSAPDVIVAVGAVVATAAAQATKDIPIIFTVPDPLAMGIVDSLARPKGNLTGQGLVSADIAGRRLQMLKEFAPQISRAAVIYNPDNPGAYTQPLLETQAAGGILQVDVKPAPVRVTDDLDVVLTKLKADGTDAVLFITDVTFTNASAKLAAATVKFRFPAIYDYREFPAAGGLMSYGPNLSEHYRRSAYYVDRVLRGTKPSDLPVEQPMKFDFVINATTAKALGLAIPERLLVFATEVIE
jgi:putative tryptophan/tyrosine transport system substrate-binding protein